MCEALAFHTGFYLKGWLIFYYKILETINSGEWKKALKYKNGSVYLVFPPCLFLAIGNH